MLNVVTALACLLIMVISFYPGGMQALAMFVALIALLVSPFLLVAVIILLFAGPRLTRLARPGSRQQFVTPLLMVLCTAVLVVFYVPRRLAFIAVQPLFDEVVAQKPRKPYHREVNRWIGPYHVDEQAADHRGGVYFRVVTHADGFIDTFSYGFAHQPNRSGSPFGDAHYQLRPLVGDWYWFKASNDW